TPQTALRENTQHYRFWGLKIFTPLTLRFQDFQRSNGLKIRYSVALSMRTSLMFLGKVRDRLFNLRARSNRLRSSVLW
ncbi:hypothetical protein, partial [Methyloglobulus sp.]|uniref:hypothetical protein n=1 Tax=Methyloglobulus sp. TaxID=2518622 RepID=UPI0032B8272E